MATYTTRELSPETWPDFERIFSQGNGWDFCWCMAFHTGPKPSRTRYRTRAEVNVANQSAKRERVFNGRAHGILVYADDAPVGWCQFGLACDLGAAEPAEDTWRITCFVVLRPYRHRGIAGIALRAALESIRRRGGHVVEAHPIAAWTHSPTGSPDAVEVKGVGLVAPAWGGFNNVSTSGTVSMFEKEGFMPVRVLEASSKRVDATGAAGYRVLMGYVIT